MKFSINRVIILLLVTGSMVFTNCGDDTVDINTDISDPGYTYSGHTLISKTVTFSSGPATCSGTSCNAIYYEGTLNGTTYQGFAASDRTNNFKIKIYRTGSPDFGVEKTDWTASITLDGIEYNGDITATATDGDPSYTLSIASGSITGFPIAGTDTIVAPKY